MLKANTIIEVLIAMVITAAVFITGVMIYFNIAGSSVTIQKLQAKSAVDEMVAATKTKATLFDEAIEKEGMTIYKTVVPYGKAPNVHHLRIEAVDDLNNTLVTYNEIITAEK